MADFYQDFYQETMEEIDNLLNYYDDEYDAKARHPLEIGK